MLHFEYTQIWMGPTGDIHVYTVELRYREHISRIPWVCRTDLEVPTTYFLCNFYPWYLKYTDISNFHCPIEFWIMRFYCVLNIWNPIVKCRWCWWFIGMEFSVYTTVLIYRYYSKAKRILQRYQHMTSFQGINQDCHQIIQQLCRTLRQQFKEKEVLF